MTDQKLVHLQREICRLKQQQMEFCAVNDELKSKLSHREKEIGRLNRILENGKTLEVLNNEHCYKDYQKEMMNLQNELKFLQSSNTDLESKLKDARSKQHEAMKHALSLAERNTQLEKELQEIDQMALTVEQDCNNSKKNSDAKVRKMQERLQTALIELQTIEKELQSLKVDKEQLRAELDGANIERRHMQSILEESLEDKKSLTDRLNNFTIIEQDLNKEIDQLVQQSARQTRIIADLKGQLMVQQSRELFSQPVDIENEQPRTARRRQTSPPKKRGHQKENKKPAASRSPSPTRRSAKHHVKKVPTNSPTRGRSHAPNDQLEYLERIKSERDFYVREYKALLEKVRKDLSGRSMNAQTSGEICPMCPEPGQCEKELGILTFPSNTNAKGLQAQISSLHFENLSLQKERHTLLERMENMRDYSDATEFLTMKASSKRLERERDILKADVNRLEEERDSIKNRIKISADMHASEIDRYKKLINDQEEQLRKSDKDRYDALQSQGTRRATIVNLEDQVETLKAQLKTSNDELIHFKTIYTQLKVLHEQTDRALVDSQNHLIHAEQELGKHEQKHNDSDNKTSTLLKDIQGYKSSIEQLAKNLIDVEREKDNLLMHLDEKTEQIAALRDEMSMKNITIEEFRQQTNSLQQKISSTIDEKNSKDCQLKCKVNDISQLKRDLEAALRSKDNVAQENKCLQEEIAAATMDSRKLKSDLEVAKRQVNELKMQLQQYCAEVKRIEDMMANKELERNEMLDQFRSLSQEANELESNNHSLESEASQNKLQLSVALDHASELEQIIAQQKALITTYEKQIADLTAQLSTLEMQLKHSQLQQERTSIEMSTLRELCSKLDRQKDDLSRQMKEKELITTQAKHELQSLKNVTQHANQTIEKEQCNARTMETILGDTREQLVEQRVMNEELQDEIIYLRKQVSEMEQNLYKVRLLAKDLCSFFDNSANLQAMHPEIRATFQNLYMGNFDNHNNEGLPSDGTTIPSGMTDLSDIVVEQEEQANIVPLPVERVPSTPTSSSIDVEEFKQHITKFGNRFDNVDKVKITKVKVTSCTQTKKGDVKKIRKCVC